MVSPHNYALDGLIYGSSHKTVLSGLKEPGTAVWAIQVNRIIPQKVFNQNRNFH